MLDQCMRLSDSYNLRWSLSADAVDFGLEAVLPPRTTPASCPRALTRRSRTHAHACTRLGTVWRPPHSDLTKPSEARPQRATPQVPLSRPTVADGPRPWCGGRWSAVVPCLLQGCIASCHWLLHVVSGPLQQRRMSSGACRLLRVCAAHFVSLHHCCRTRDGLWSVSAADLQPDDGWRRRRCRRRAAAAADRCCVCVCLRACVVAVPCFARMCARL